MKLIDNIYRTRVLSEYGRFILIALLLILIAGNIFIPEYPVQDIDDQLLSLKGKHFKYADQPHVKEFLRSVKRNGGYICLGTSESTKLRDGNYYEFLDNDTSYTARFSKLGGAGWTCGLHMPMLMMNPEEADSLNIIYFINPVYWRSELNHFDKGYWTRYLNYGNYKNISTQNIHQGFSEVSAPYAEKINFGEKLLYRLEYWLRKIRKPFFHDLKYRLFPHRYMDDLDLLTVDKGSTSYDFFGRIDTSYLDTTWNITHEFHGRTWLNPISENDYRYRELKAFNDLCNELNVNVTYVLGPVNEIYIARYHPPYLQAYLETIDKIRILLDEEGADIVDVSELGRIPGSFIDNQHHSSYGAFLIYQKIKHHLHEKNGL